MYDLLKSRGLITVIVFRLGVIAFIILGGFFLARYFIVRTSGCMPACINVNMIDRSLQGADLHRVNFTDAILRRANLSGTNLRDADLSGANLTETNLQNADLRGARMVGADLRKADLRGAVFSGTDLRGARLEEADLTRANLTEVRLLGVDLTKAKLVEANLSNSRLAGISFLEADLSGADLSGANLVGAYLSRADLSGTRLQGADLTGAWLNLANLTGADLTNASLFGARMLGASLASAKLQGSGLSGALIIGANLRGADLRAANLQSIRLFQTELAAQDIQLDPVIADLNDLQRSTVLVDADLRGVEFNSSTRWPTGKLVLLSNMLGRQFAETVAVEVVVEEEATATEEATGEEAATPELVIEEPEEVGPAVTVFSSNGTDLLTQTLYNLFQQEGYTDTVALRAGLTADAIELFCQMPEADAIVIGRALSQEELTACAGLDRQPLEMQFAVDAQVIVANPANEFFSDIAYQDIPLLLTVENWWDLNNEWPSEPILRYLPNVETGALDIIAKDFFSDTVEPLTQSPNTFFTEDVNEQIQAIAVDPHAVGMMSFSRFTQNAEILKAITINEVEPEPLMVNSGAYTLTRPLYIYMDIEAVATNPELGLFFNFYLNRLSEVREKAGFFPVRVEFLDSARAKLQQIRGTDTVTATIDFAFDLTPDDDQPTPEANATPEANVADVPPDVPAVSAPTVQASVTITAAPTGTVTPTRTVTPTAEATAAVTPAPTSVPTPAGSSTPESPTPGGNNTPTAVVPEPSPTPVPEEEATGTRQASGEE